MRSLVVYNSKTGFTQRYARWIAAKLNCEAVAEKDMTPKQWQESGIIIYGGPLMAGKVLGWDKIKSRITESGKQAIVYTVGATPMAAEDIIQKVQNDNLSEAEQKNIPFFYFEGGINYENMGFFSKMILKMMYQSLKNKKDKTPEEIGMMKTFEASSDCAREEYVEPLVEWVEQQKVHI